MFNRVGYEILHLILAIIILLNVLDFFSLLNPFWDFVKKIVSWTLIAVVFYKLQPSKIILGARNKAWDCGLVVAGLFFVVDGMIRYASIMREQLLANIGLYYDWFMHEGVGTIITVSDEVFFQIQLGVGVTVNEHMRSFAEQTTLMSTQTIVTFENTIGEQLTYLLGSNTLNGTLLPLFNTLHMYAGVIQQTSLFIAISLCIVLALVVALRIPIEKKSLVGIIDSGIAHGFARILARLSFVFVILVTFLLFVFSPVVEWLAIAVDAPILMFAVLVSLGLLLLHRTHFSGAQWEEWVTDFGSNIEPYVNLFREKKTVLLGVSGILVLHLVIEVFNYIMPFVLPVQSQLYLSQLSTNYENLFVLMSGAWWIPIIVLNVIAWVFVLCLPGYIWYKIYELKTRGEGDVRFSPLILGLFYSSVITTLLVPLIWFSRVVDEGLIGVAFYTQTGVADEVVILMIAVAVFVITYFLAQFSARRFLYLGPVLLPLVFMAWYTWLYFESAFTYYLTTMYSAFVAGLVGLGLIFGLFLVLSCLFYISAYTFFAYEVIKEEH